MLGDLRHSKVNVSDGGAWEDILGVVLGVGPLRQLYSEQELFYSLCAESDIDLSFSLQITYN